MREQKETLIETLSNRSLVEKVLQLCHIRGEKMALNKNIENDLDVDISMGKKEILRRLEIQERLIPDLIASPLE